MVLTRSSRKKSVSIDPLTLCLQVVIASYAEDARRFVYSLSTAVLKRNTANDKGIFEALQLIWIRCRNGRFPSYVCSPLIVNRSCRTLIIKTVECKYG